MNYTCTHSPLAKSKDGATCFACDFQAKYPTPEAARIAAADTLELARQANRSPFTCVWDEVQA